MNFGIHSSSFSFVVRQGLWCSVRARRTRGTTRVRTRAAAPAAAPSGAAADARSPAAAPAPGSPPATDTFAVMYFAKSNVSRQSGVRESGNARQFSSIIHA